jgi:transcriptional regulator with PAS, ATPase and Fis domain
MRIDEQECVTFLGVPAVISSPVMQELMRLAERAARTNATVLITGESGSGKEIVARAVHHYSMRCVRPWVDVCCAALPEQLMESELFGYEKGAFSGADACKPGLFELAHTGTIFLDEIGELDPRMQVKLLRVLDGAPYYRLGGVRKITVDVRVIAATNQDLQACIDLGRFRRDLYHRLSQVSLQVPPLRERRPDIGPLAQFFLRQQDERFSFTDEAVQSLERYTWPGNVRELRNTVFKALVAASGFAIHAAELPAEVCREPALPEPTSSGRLDGMERELILRTLAQTGGHQQRTADLLGISRRTLIRKLKTYRNQDHAAPT